MTTEIKKDQQETFRLKRFTTEWVGDWDPNDINRFSATDLPRLVGLAHETGYILSTFPTTLFPERIFTELTIHSDPNKKPIIKHGILVAYKYHLYGGSNSIEIQEGEEVEGERQTKLSFEGHTTSFKKVTVTTTRIYLRGDLKELISMGREAGAESDLKSHGVNHPTKTYYPDFLPPHSP